MFEWERSDASFLLGNCDLFFLTVWKWTSTFFTCWSCDCDLRVCHDQTLTNQVRKVYQWYQRHKKDQTLIFITFANCSRELGFCFSKATSAQIHCFLFLYTCFFLCWTSLFCCRRKKNCYLFQRTLDLHPLGPRDSRVGQAVPGVRSPGEVDALFVQVSEGFSHHLHCIVGQRWGVLKERKKTSQWLKYSTCQFIDKLNIHFISCTINCI